MSTSSLGMKDISEYSEKVTVRGGDRLRELYSDDVGVLKAIMALGVDVYSVNWSGSVYDFVSVFVFSGATTNHGVLLHLSSLFSFIFSEQTERLGEVKLSHSPVFYVNLRNWKVRREREAILIIIKHFPRHMCGWGKVFNISSVMCELV